MGATGMTLAAQIALLKRYATITEEHARKEREVAQTHATYGYCREYRRQEGYATGMQHVKHLVMAAAINEDITYDAMRAECDIARATMADLWLDLSRQSSTITREGVEQYTVTSATYFTGSAWALDYIEQRRRGFDYALKLLDLASVEEAMR